MVTPNDIIVLLSGEGSTLQAILDNCKVANVVGVFSNKTSANGLNRARNAGVPFVNGSSNNEQDILNDIINVMIAGVIPRVIILAGYMRVLSPSFIKYFEERNIPIINIHPSLLPAHKGLHTHRKVLENGDEYHGMTIHYVNEELDGGPIINQYEFRVEETDTEETLTQKVKELEQNFYPKIIDALLLTVH